MEILAVVVLYKTEAAQSQTLTSLSNILNASPGLLDSVRVLVWDNSPEPVLDACSGLPATYFHSGMNTGLSGAYNHAASLAQKQGIPWLLLLDQDTHLPMSFLSDMLGEAAALKEQNSIAAIVPTVFVGEQQVSPHRVMFNRHRPYPIGIRGVAEGEATAINSGALLRVASLFSVGGYSTEFWLDYSDWYIFRQFHLHGLRVWRAADIRIQHSMTVMDYDSLMSEWRYTNFIAAEGAFNDLYNGAIENAVQTFRLLIRTVRQRRRFKNPIFSRITFRHFIWRVTRRRKQRIRLWRLSSTQRDIALAAKGPVSC